MLFQLGRQPFTGQPRALFVEGDDICIRRNPGQDPLPLAIADEGGIGLFAAALLFLELHHLQGQIAAGPAGEFLRALAKEFRGKLADAQKPQLHRAGAFRSQ